MKDIICNAYYAPGYLYDIKGSTCNGSRCAEESNYWFWMIYLHGFQNGTRAWFNNTQEGIAYIDKTPLHRLYYLLYDSVDWSIYPI